MGVEAGIFRQYLNPIRSMADYSADLDKAESNKLALVGQRRQNEIAGLQADVTRQSMADAMAKQNAIREIYSANPTAKPMERAQLLQANPLTAGDGIAAEKGILDNEGKRASTSNAQAEADAKVADAKYKAMAHHAQGLAYVRTPQDVVTYIDQGIAKGVFPADAREQALEKAQSYPSIDAWRKDSEAAAVPAVDKFKADADMARSKLSSDTQITTTRMSNETSRANNSASVAQSERSSLRADARSKESNSASLSKPFEVTGPDGLPVLVRQDKQGNITPVSGFGPKAAADKPMTDAQAKAALFGSRMETSNKILEGLADSGTEVSVPGSRSGFGVGSVINALSPAKQQQLDQAKRDFINATLRRESGAVITDAEFSNGDKQYFPQVGDSAAVKAQKAGNRAIAVRGVQAEVPKANRGVLAEIQGKDGADAKPSAGGNLSATESAELEALRARFKK